MSDGAMDDRELLKARFSQWTNTRELTPPPGAEPQAIETDRMSPNEPVMRKGFDKIQLKIRRSQAKGYVRGVQFNVHFIAELSPEALQAVKHYRFGKIILYQKPLELKLSFNIFRALWRAIWLTLTRSRWRITVNDLIQGRTVKCKDVVELMDVQDDIREATELFATILRTAAWFGGEEVIDM